MIPLKDNIATRRFPILTVILIVVNVAIYFGVEQGGLGLGQTGEERVVEYGAIPCEITGSECVDKPPGEEVPPWFTLLSSMFLHGSLLHLGGNMLFLWIFGNNIEDSMSRWRFALFYILGGLAALLAQVAFDPDAAVPTVGASGAIAAVLGGYAILYPRARVVTVILIIFFFTILELPALLVLGLWFVMQLLPAFSEPVAEGGGGVAYFAHIGGFVFGLALIKLLANRVHEEYDREQRIPVY